MKTFLKRALGAVCILFLLMNTVAAIHAFRFTHFADANTIRTKDTKQLTTGEKLKALIAGVDIPRPINEIHPSHFYETVKLRADKEIECWYVPHMDLVETDTSLGTIIVFHGYAGKKSAMIDKADEFYKLGYNVMLVDFMGSGGSEGNQTSVGYKEAEQVKICYDFIARRGEKRIFLFGTSMGAVAIIKSINDYHFSPSGIIVECPFGTMYKTICSRFSSMNVPAFPMAGLLAFWGGVENGFSALSFSVEEYAKAVGCPVLLLYGACDDKVSREEINIIYNNFAGSKSLVVYSQAGHENYLLKYKNEWVTDVAGFLNRN